jgi:phosphatidylinositol glycan class A protein
VNLEQMRETHELQDRVTLFGSIENSKIRDVRLFLTCQILVQGDIFLNTSLTEAFCIAIVEAASCGLLVVSTRVGGIPEVLPYDLPVQLADPDADALVDALEIAIRGLNASPVDKWKMHGRVKGMYSWERVAVRTEGVYEGVMEMRENGIGERFARYYTTGSWAGKLSVLIVAFDYFVLWVLELIWPASGIERARKM